MRQLYAMDTFFYHGLGSYPFEARCAMLRELGYDATYLTLWDEQAWRDLDRLSSARETYGLEVAAVYAVLDLTQSPDAPEAARITAMLERLQGCGRVELALTMGDSGLAPSDPEGDRLAIEWLSRLLSIAERNRIRISLYPHVFFWLERWEDALRLTNRLDHPLLGIAFGSFHWFAVDGRNLKEALTACAPRLHAVNLCGSRKLPPGSGLPASIETIDRGELDVFYLLGALKATGYDGMVGFQGYGMGGDAYGNLERNRQTYTRMTGLLDRFPDWAASGWNDSR
ncbi:sugar phosphate isomerase/epimerase family protein [Cohnella nanjingensis]|uniref:Sugar phosphate isomerase/epimerase n=1 Tax=Cohnella nanjingensis TaxID=1387779 RepID=A0A7X0RQS7_9BACL|nr:TIM barrel protein [Cohnella nanjingensis]MBB6670695.1 sugar phosphate isomerase/epimerase [Cohnella nanjingensis]